MRKARDFPFEKKQQQRKFLSSSGQLWPVKNQTSATVEVLPVCCTCALKVTLMMP